MKKRSVYNMIISILCATFSFVLVVLGIIFQSIKHRPLAIVFLSIFMVFIITHFILESIYYGLDESLGKTVMHRLSKIFSDISTTLVLLYFVLCSFYTWKWILFGFILLFLVFEVLIDSFGKIVEFKYLLSFFKTFCFCFLFFSQYNGFLLFIGTFSVIVYFLSNFLGDLLHHKTILSFSVVSVVLFGIFFIFL